GRCRVRDREGDRCDAGGPEPRLCRLRVGRQRRLARSARARARSSPAPMRATLLAIAACSAPPAPAVRNAAPATRTPVLTDDWKAVCQQRLSAVADEFRHRAPSIYPDYAELGWTNEPEISSSDAYARVRINPGRTWSFIASAAPRD